MAKPARKVPRGVGWRVGVIGLAILFALMVLMVCVAGTDPSRYERAHMAPGEVWHYASSDVAVALICMAIELAIAIAVLSARWAFAIWWRTVIMIVVQLVAIVVISGTTHDSGPMEQHVLWLLLAAVFLLLFAIGAKIAAVIDERRPKSPDLDEVFD